MPIPFLSRRYDRPLQGQIANALLATFPGLHQGCKQLRRLHASRQVTSRGVTMEQDLADGVHVAGIFPSWPIQERAGSFDEGRAEVRVDR